jgi:hypothetical protein
MQGSRLPDRALIARSDAGREWLGLECSQPSALERSIGCFCQKQTFVLADPKDRLWVGVGRKGLG